MSTSIISGLLYNTHIFVCSAASAAYGNERIISKHWNFWPSGGNNETTNCTWNVNFVSADVKQTIFQHIIATWGRRSGLRLEKTVKVHNYPIKLMRMRWSLLATGKCNDVWGIEYFVTFSSSWIDGISINTFTHRIKIERRESRAELRVFKVGSDLKCKMIHCAELSGRRERVKWDKNNYKYIWKL